MESCQILSNLVEFCQILMNPAKTCQNLSRPVKFCQILSILSNPVKQYPILSNPVESWWILLNPFKSCQIRSYSILFIPSRPAQPFLDSYFVCFYICLFVFHLFIKVWRLILILHRCVWREFTRERMLRFVTICMTQIKVWSVLETLQLFSLPKKRGNFWTIKIKLE